MERRASERLTEGGKEGKVIGFPTPRGETPTLLHRKEGSKGERKEGGQSPIEGRDGAGDGGLSLRWPPIHETQSLLPSLKFQALSYRVFQNHIA